MSSYSKNSIEEQTNQINERLRIYDIINVLGDNFSNIYSVNRHNQEVTIYRYENTSVGVKEAIKGQNPYQDAIKQYIDNNVFHDDKEKMVIATDLNNICKQLEQVPHFSVHYRVKRNGEILYFYMKCARIGSADSFEDIVLAFANEDFDIRRNKLESLTRVQHLHGKPKILIVEDNQLTCDILCSLLEDYYDVITAENGKVGLNILETQYKDISLILLDVEMPICNGIEFLQRVKDDALLSLVPIIVITASNDSQTELECLKLGALDFITKPYNSEIVKSRIHNMIRLKESTMTLAAVENDELTGLYTEQAFLHYAKTIMKLKPDKKMHIIEAKIKDFKLINSLYGLKKGDDVLIYLASAYQKMIKNSIVARSGSSSFICLIYTDQDINHEKLFNIINEINNHAPINGLKVKYGVYENIDKTLPISTICNYTSIVKESIMEDYNNDVAFYTEAVAQKQLHNQMIENDFERAFNNNEFVVYYQPKIDITHETVIGAEALVRWKKTDGTMISPGEFIPIYEKNGLVARLDEYVFKKVCEHQKRELEQGKTLLPISINLSRCSVLHEDIATRYVQIVKENHIPFSCVQIELTESAAIHSDCIKNSTDQLFKSGFKLHMDDFGSGYSSLTSLNQFPFSTLKIDKSLIDHVCQQKGKTLVEQVIVLSKLLNMTVVAEGVETKEQLDEIRKMDCDEVQGYYYAKPMSEENYKHFINNYNQ